jgi:hypothetical protein
VEEETPVIAKTLILCSTCLVLAGCVTDKISMSSEVGGDGAGTSFRSTGVSSIVDGGAGAGPIGNTGGLGVTGDEGVIANVIGDDPLGGVLDGALGDGNIVSQILGSPDGTKGLVPELAAGAAGDPDADILNGGIGLTGEDGLIADLTGGDFGGAVLGTQGVIPASLAGGNDGLLGALLGDHVDSPALGPVAEAVPTSALVAGLAQVPALGVTGQGGVVASLIGADLAGNLVGTGGVLGGGNTGAIGSQMPQGSAPLAPLGDAVVGALNTVAGNTQSPLAGTGLGTILNSLPGAPSSGTTAGGASIPVVGSVLSGSSNGGGLASTVTDALAPVTQAVGAVPVVGGLLATH